MNYRETEEQSKSYKQLYADGMERLIQLRQEEAAAKRAGYVKNIFRTPEVYRSDFKKMLGWPLVDHCTEGLPQVKKTKLAEENGCSIYRMQFEILDGLVLTGLYFEQNGEGKRPLVLVQHGGLGTPELISGLYGSTANYHQILERVIARGVHAFAPQLLLWDPKYDVPFDRIKVDARLKRVGSSITAVELYGLTRILDYFEAQAHISRFGMVGLSYGGFYTLFMAALDKRIQSAISCAFFNTRDQYPWADWTWLGAAEQFDDAEIACLVYPRKLHLEIADKDPLFDVAYGKKSFQRLKELCKEVGTDWVSLEVFSGDHEFSWNDAPIEELVRCLS